MLEQGLLVDLEAEGAAKKDLEADLAQRIEAQVQLEMVVRGNVQAGLAMQELLDDAVLFEVRLGLAIILLAFVAAA